MKYILLFVAMITFPALSAYQLDNSNSTLSFITIKKGDVSEAHTFNQLKGSFDQSGNINFEIDLTSVNTKIAIRDTRIQQYLFNTEVFPTASFNAKMDISDFNNITVGESRRVTLPGTIDLHGIKQAITTEILLVKLSKQQFIVSSTQPVLFNATSFSLVTGVKKLQELAGLPSISNAVPVNFVLTFKQ